MVLPSLHLATTSLLDDSSTALAVVVRFTMLKHFAPLMTLGNIRKSPSAVSHFCNLSTKLHLIYKPFMSIGKLPQ